MKCVVGSSIGSSRLFTAYTLYIQHSNIIYVGNDSERVATKGNQLRSGNIVTEIQFHGHELFEDIVW